MSFKVTIRATSITVQPGQESLLPLAPLLDMHEYEDEYQEMTKVLGYMLDETHDILYLHKGVDIDYLRRLLNDVEFTYELFDPYKEMNYQFEEAFPPKNEDQEDVIKFLSAKPPYNENLRESQIFLVKTGGFGKMEPYSRKIPTPTVNGYIAMGDLKIGDQVFGENGNPVRVVGIFDHGVQPVYEITFADGRTAYCGKDHLWKIYYRNNDPTVIDTTTLMSIYRRQIPVNRQKPDWDVYEYNCRIPTCKPLQYEAKHLPVDPYVLGCFIGNGCCRERVLTISSPDRYVPNKIAKIYGFTVKKLSKNNFSYAFYKHGKPVQTKEFFADIPEISGAFSYEKRIPDGYMYNSIENRMALIQGLMDTDGSISYGDGRYRISYSSTSEELLKQIQWLFWSMGWTGIIHNDNRPEKYTSGYCGILIPRVQNSDKSKLFTYPPKRKLADAAYCKKQDDRYSKLLIKNIRLSHYEECRCIMVDNPTHLYLTENCIVTHNTFCAGYAMGELGMKTLIIMHRDSLRSQWVKSLYDLNGYSSREVYELTSSAELEAIANGHLKLDYDIYLMTHATFQAACNRIRDCEKIHNITKNLHIGLKIIDEAHLYFRDTLLMDFLFNVKRNVYLTATDGRSSKDEDAIFRHAFSKAVFYRKISIATDKKHPDKWVEYITIDIDTKCPTAVYKYRVNGGRGMSAVSYGKWVIQRDKRQTHFKVCRDILKTIYDKEPSAKVIIFMPLIDLCTDCAYFLNMELSNDPSFEYSLDIKTVNSHNSKSDNEYNKRSADVIVTTIQSLGTGSDIKGITDIINCSPIVSKIVVKQVLWRIRYIPKPCHYYDIVDVSVPMDRHWWSSRKRTLEAMTTRYSHIAWSEEVTEE